jgi:predicted AAA+ superfamily ATPase
MQDRLILALENFRIVTITGPRQSGKTTLTKQIANDLDMRYVTFDDTQVLELAKQSPKDFLDFYAKEPLVIDEIQFVPELIPYLKQFVDDKNKKGMFLLTGSADMLSMSKITESLAGRMVTYHLYPLSNKELNKHNVNIVDKLFDGTILEIDLKKYTNDLTKTLDDIIQGGYPEVLELNDTKLRKDWFKSYISSRIQKDIVTIKDVHEEKLGIFPKLIKVMANQTGGLLNINQIAKKLQCDNKTIKNYIEILKAMFIVKTIPPYFSNRSLSVVKSEKLHFIDTGLVCSLLGVDVQNLLFNKDKEFGNIIENAVYCEILKQQTVSQIDINIYHYRDLRKKEVDLILESTDGQIIPIEIKAKLIIKKDDLKGMIEVMKHYDNIKYSFVIYGGDEIRPANYDGFLVYLIPMKIFL